MTTETAAAIEATTEAAAAAAAALDALPATKSELITTAAALLKDDGKTHIVDRLYMLINIAAAGLFVFLYRGIRPELQEAGRILMVIAAVLNAPISLAILAGNQTKYKYPTAIGAGLVVSILISLAGVVVSVL